MQKVWHCDGAPAEASLIKTLRVYLYNYQHVFDYFI